MSSAHIIKAAIKEAQRRAARDKIELTADELADAVENVLRDWREQAAEEAAEREDTPCLESCDQWGTGEGRYHGLIG